MLYQELAAHDAPRLVLAFVGIHHAASTCWSRARTSNGSAICLRSSTARSGCRASPSPKPGPTSPRCAPQPAGEGDEFVVNGQKLWASGGMHADWCLLLARTDPDAPKRKGISYFLLDMTTPGVDVRPIRNAIGDSHFCEIFLDDVRIPAANLIGAENAGWQVAQETLGAERGMTMLELAERLGKAGFRWLVESAPVDDPIVADRLAQFDTELTALRGMCRRIVEHGACAGLLMRPIVKLYYSELLQRLTDFAVEIGGPEAHTVLAKPMSSGWESGSWVARFRRILGVDHSRRSQRDPADHHRRTRARVAARAERGVSDRISPSSTTSCARSPATCWPRTARPTGRCSSTPAGPGWRCPTSSAVLARPSPKPR